MKIGVLVWVKYDKETYLAFRAILTLTTMVLNPAEKSTCSVTFLPHRLLSRTKAGNIKSIADASATQEKKYPSLKHAYRYIILTPLNSSFI